MKLAHFVLPHPKTHKKAHLLSEKSLLIYLLFFVLLQLGFRGITYIQPGVLGTTSAITNQQIIFLTNEERQKYGLPILKDNGELDKAADEKAKNMFAENYWAHYSPSGKSPWFWMQQTGYNYEYAGENLARGFSNSNDVVAAWMASKMGHRENLLGKNYQEIGIAVEDGVLNGEKTTLVVQMFGTPVGAIASNPSVGEGGASAVADNKIATNIPSSEVPASSPEVNSANTENIPQPSILSRFITINPLTTTKTLGLMLLGLLAFLGILDLYVISRRKKAFVQLHTRHLPHATFISAIIIGLFILHAGSII